MLLATLFLFTSFAEWNDAHHSVLQWGFYPGQTTCDVGGMTGAVELKLSGDLCLSIGGEYYTLKCTSNGEFTATEKYTDATCTTPSDGEMSLDINLSGEDILDTGNCRTWGNGGLLIGIDHDDQFGFERESSYQFPSLQCQAEDLTDFTQPGGDVALDFRAVLFQEDNCGGEPSELEFRIHFHHPDDMCKDWLGPGLGHFSFRCHGEDHFTFQYWDKDSTCKSKPRVIYSMYSDDFQVPDGIADFLEDTFDEFFEDNKGPQQPWGYGTCVNLGDFDDDLANLSIQISDIRCFGRAAVYDFTPEITEMEDETPKTFTPSDDWVPMESAVLGFAAYPGPETCPEGNAFSGEIEVTMEFEEGLDAVCVKEMWEDDEKYFSIYTKEGMMISMRKYDNSDCTGDYEEMLSEEDQNIVKRFTDVIEFGIDECSPELDLPDVGDDQYTLSGKITTMKGNADTGFIRSTAGDIYFHLHAKMHVGTGCESPAQNLHFKIKLHNPEFACQEWAGKGFGYMKFMCNGRDMGAFHYFGSDSTCRGTPRFSYAINMEDYFLPANVVRFLNSQIEFDTPLGGPNGDEPVGYATCVSVKGMSFKLQDLQCTGHSRFNPFTLKMTCGSTTKMYVETPDGYKQLVDSNGVPVLSGSVPVYLNDDCTVTNPTILCEDAFCNGNGIATGNLPHCQCDCNEDSIGTRCETMRKLKIEQRFAGVTKEQFQLTVESFKQAFADNVGHLVHKNKVTVKSVTEYRRQRRLLNNGIQVEWEVRIDSTEEKLQVQEKIQDEQFHVQVAEDVKTMEPLLTELIAEEATMIEPCVASLHCGNTPGVGVWTTMDTDASDGCTCTCASNWSGDDCNEGGLSNDIVMEYANEGLSAGAIVGIIIGVLAFIALASALAFYLYSQKKPVILAGTHLGGDVSNRKVFGTGKGSSGSGFVGSENFGGDVMNLPRQAEGDKATGKALE